MPALEVAHMGQFELEVELDVAPEQAWRALTEDIDKWWLPDFRVVGERSVVRLHARAGGALVEVAPDGAEIVWYTVQMVRPGSALYMVGHTAAEWGGPSISMLKLALTPRSGGTLLTISDSIVGRITESDLANISSGWEKLFGAGLKRHVAGAH